MLRESRPIYGGIMALQRIPTIVLLRRVPSPLNEFDLRSAVRSTVGPQGAATLRHAGSNACMTYFEWRMGGTTCNIGLGSQPLRDVGAKCDATSGEMIEWHDRDISAPEEPELRAAWESHLAWLYVDAFDDSAACLSALFRLAAHLVDEDTLLIWDCRALNPPRGPMLLPTPHVQAALASGNWPH